MSEFAGETVPPIVNKTIGGQVFCRYCGESIKKEAEICPKCGVRQIPIGPVKAPLAEDESEKSRMIALIFWVCLNGYGAHHFYAGRIGTGILQLFFGWATFYIWNLVDLIFILSGTFKDEKGKKLTRWDF